MRGFSLRLLASLCVMLGLAACDAAPGASDLGNLPPVVSEFSFQPTEVFVTPAAGGDEAEITVPVTVQVQAVDPEGALAQVGVLVQALSPSAAPVAEQLLPAAGNGRYEATLMLQLPAGSSGGYTVRAYAVDDAGQLSNDVRGTFHLIATPGEPPVIEEVVYPATVRIPAQGATTRFAVVARVTDQDGQDNINRVVLRNAAGSEFALRDDGGANGSLSGDATAGDGRYTITFEINEATAEGAVSFEVRATDRTGLDAKPVTITITFTR